MKKAILVANGFTPSKSLINSLIKLGYTFIIGVDGGNNFLIKLGIIPDLVIGDFDSIKKVNLKRLNKLTKVKIIKRQNDTDVEKAIKFLIRHKYTEAILLGGTGNRLDHSIANISFVLKYFDKIRLSLVHLDSILTPYSGDVTLATKINEIVSLYTFNPETLVTSSGLKYRLSKTSLMMGVKDSTSNLAVRNKVKLNIINGVAIIIRNLKLVLSNGLI